MIPEKPDGDFIEDVFLKVTDTGIRKGIYWNTDFLKMFGGTFDTFTKVFLRSCFKEFGLDDIKTFHHIWYSWYAEKSRKVHLLIRIITHRSQEQRRDMPNELALHAGDLQSRQFSTACRSDFRDPGIPGRKDAIDLPASADPQLQMYVSGR